MIFCFKINRFSLKLYFNSLNVKYVLLDITGKFLKLSEFKINAIKIQYLLHSDIV